MVQREKRKREGDRERRERETHTKLVQGIGMNEGRKKIQPND